jgi:D-sedoheptulose 7-phosphate isomerase
MNLQEFKTCINGFSGEEQTTLKSIIDSHHNIIILGNGGSNAVASHIAEDYTKMMGKRAITFSDPPMLTCYANDYGWDNTYKMFLEHFLLPDSLVITISSSGRSKNILNATEYALTKANVITLSGFEPDNPLRTIYGQKSLMHFYVPSKDYGIVEIIHSLILHSVI